MKKYLQIEPRLEITKGLGTVELAPGIYKIEEVYPSMEDEVEPIKMAEFFIGCYTRDKPEYANVFASIDQDSILMIVPDYDYKNPKRFWELRENIFRVCSDLEFCNVRWFHISKNHLEFRELMSEFHQYSITDIERCGGEPYVSGLSSSSLLICNHRFYYETDWLRSPY